MSRSIVCPNCNLPIDDSGARSALVGLKFRQRIEAIVEAFITLKNDLEAEKRLIPRLWASRERQLERAVMNATDLYGEFGGIFGPSLPQLANLEFPTFDGDSDLLALEPADADLNNCPF